jgi:hypothetical protein
MGRLVCAYRDPALAFFLNQAHAGLSNPVAWLCWDAPVAADDGVRVGVESLTIAYKVEVPAPSTAQWVRFGILSTLAVYNEGGFARWAGNWLGGQDRSAVTARKVELAEGARLAEYSSGAGLLGCATKECGVSRAAMWAARGAVDAGELAYTEISSRYTKPSLAKRSWWMGRKASTETTQRQRDLEKSMGMARAHVPRASVMAWDLARKVELDFPPAQPVDWAGVAQEAMTEISLVADLGLAGIEAQVGGTPQPVQAGRAFFVNQGEPQ